ncbi:MAG: hypothetical protein NC131_13215 [Roseburia sp.]|nr:hypothetical protein [Roseburia sp.]
MKKEQDGYFTPNQIKLAKEIAQRIAKLHKSGCAVVGKQNELVCYKNKDWQHSVENINYAGAIPTRVPYLECGHITDSGADDELYFEAGYLNEDEL